MTIEENKQLKDYNTFGISATAKYFTECESLQQFQQLIRQPVYQNSKKLILGGGSNMLLTQNFDGLVIKNSIPGIEVVTESDTQVEIKAGAGVVWHQLVLWCIERNYGGIENLSLIPGLVGASPMQNIGAYGVEIKDVFKQLEAVDVNTGELVIFNRDDCGFGYRESVFKNKYRDRYFIASVTFSLTRVDAPGAAYRFKTDYGDIKHTLAEMMVFDLSLKAVSDAVIKIRTLKLPDPKVLGNAGSFFKNPSVSEAKYRELADKNPVMPSYPNKGENTYKIPAGWLIEQCGWKGKVVGHTGAHAKQALVLVNYGGASGSDVLHVAEEIQQSVFRKFGIHIQPEVNII